MTTTVPTHDDQWQGNLSARLKGESPLKGIISDEAIAALHRVTASTKGKHDAASFQQASDRAIHIIVSDLDGADGKFDGKITHETLVRKAGKMAAIWGVDPKKIVAELEQGSTDKEIPAADLEARAKRVIGEIFGKIAGVTHHSEPDAKNPFPDNHAAPPSEVKPGESIRIPQFKLPDAPPPRYHNPISLPRGIKVDAEGPVEVPGVPNHKNSGTAVSV